DFQRRNLVAFQGEEKSQVHGVAGEAAGQPAGDDDRSVPLFAGERLARVLVLRRDLLLPLPDGSPPTVGPALVLHDGSFREASGNGLAVLLVGGEVGGDGSWQIERHRSSLQVRKTGSLAPCVSWTRRETDRDNSAPGFFNPGAAPRTRPRSAA